MAAVRTDRGFSRDVVVVTNGMGPDLECCGDDANELEVWSGSVLVRVVVNGVATLLSAVVVLVGPPDGLPVANDLAAWLRGLKGRSGVTAMQFPLADHLFLDGTGPPTPLEYEKPSHIDPKLTPAIASWIEHVASRLLSDA